MKSKRGAFPFNILVVVALTILLVYAWIQLDNKYNGTFKRHLGEKQYDLIKTYQKGEQVLFYTDQSAQYSLEQSVYDLANSGGITEIDAVGSDQAPFYHECGKFGGAYVWNVIKKDADSKYSENGCFDESLLNSNMKLKFNNNLNAYLLNYPEKILTDNYNYELSDNLQITGKALKPLKFNIGKNNGNKITS